MTFATAIFTVAALALVGALCLLGLVLTAIERAKLAELEARRNALRLRRLEAERAHEEARAAVDAASQQLQQTLGQFILVLAMPRSTPSEKLN